MAKRRVLKFNFGKLADLVETLEENKEKAVIEAIENASKKVQPKLDKFFEVHKISGNADESLITNPKIYNNRGRIGIQLGFDKSKPHGSLAYYFEHGTPKNNPQEYKFINDAFRNKEVRKELRDTIKKYIAESQPK